MSNYFDLLLHLVIHSPLRFLYGTRFIFDGMLILYHVSYIQLLYHNILFVCVWMDTASDGQTGDDDVTPTKTRRRSRRKKLRKNGASEEDILTQSDDERDVSADDVDTHVCVSDNHVHTCLDTRPHCVHM